MSLEENIWDTLNAVWSETASDNDYPDHRPLLAHYTSVKSLQSIITSGQIWMANPLYMNDFEEVRFGVLEGIRLFLANDNLADSFSEERQWKLVRDAYENEFAEFDQRHAVDTYIFCLSEFDREIDSFDGRLSMWRGYGGGGDGVAILIDTEKFSPEHGYPLILSRVVYGSQELRRDAISQILDGYAKILAGRELSDLELPVIAKHIFLRLLNFSLYTKHSGFEEEREWRIVYTPAYDPTNKFVSMLSYDIHGSGVVPKLKLDLEEYSRINDFDFSLKSICAGLILGPTQNSRLYVEGIYRLLQDNGYNELLDKVHSSSIPFRAT